MTNKIPPLPALRAFESAARHLSLRRAAEELHVTHGAISHQIKFLQESLGVELLQRVGRGVGLTHAGQQLAPKLTDVFKQLVRAMEEVQPKPARRTLRVSVLPSFAAKWLLARLPRFMALHPHIELTLDASLTVVDLQREGVDVALRYGAGDWPGVQAEKLMDEDMLVVASPHYLGPLVPTRAADILAKTLLRDNAAVTWQDWCNAAGVGPVALNSAIVFNDAGLLVQAAVEGQGVALVRSVLVQDDLAAGRLMRLPGPVLAAAYSYYLVTPRHRELSDNAQVFLAWIKAEVRQPTPSTGAHRLG
ncbi:MAG: transcriptional regulator GcvA [Rhodoferax sp.]|nr:transcriptional regulator GcvA [Rhodoferax sp.]MDP3650543.1 transcriptional regulator GcvA [Rhodoferax sp.]